MNKYTFYLLTIFITYSFCSEVCNDVAKNYQLHLGTKTPYRIVANNTFGKIEYQGCKPNKMWMIIRHGTRNPSESFIESMDRRLPKIRDLILKNNPTSSDVLHNSDLIALQHWENKLKKKDQKKLTREGENEMIDIAERMQSRFPMLLSNIYSNTSYKFKHTDSQRTRKSAYYFSIGLFGKQIAKSVWYPEPSKKDPILRFYKLCSKWKKDVKENPESLLHRKEFEISPLMIKTIQEVNQRLKLSLNKLNFDDIYLMYSTCSYETAWKMNQKSPWCSAFSLNDMKVLEYYEDLKYYWLDGYGYNLNHNQACVVFDEIVSYFGSKNEYPKSTIYFSHSGTLLKLLAHLQLYKEDKPLTRHNFNDKVDNRNFRVSRVSPFGTNLAMVLFDCGGVQKVLTLHQEHIIRLPSCPTTDLCEFNSIVDYYRSATSTCNFDEICGNKGANETTDSTDDE
ncbi:hypothetical protein HHI36_015509 [Cryptolaemus montrouzieri]|uniref:Multiple inositol polyphosphate phosphatase 1 n=1 Tax=Cryptolaemus montrouzieri TaxID=559131 RepID=A0ABD2N5V0_9CUCU